MPELGDDELSYALREIGRALKPGGLLLVMDIVVLRNLFDMVVNVLAGLLFRAVVYLLTQAAVRSIKDLPGKNS